MREVQAEMADALASIFGNVGPEYDERFAAPDGDCA